MCSSDLMSHELKTPLNAVIGFADLMRQELFGPVNEPRYRSYIVDIHDNGRRLLTMINDILDLSRVEGGLLGLDEEPVCLFDIVLSAKDEVVESKPEAAPIAVEVPPDLPLLYADRRRVRQILLHLFSNAVKFTPREGSIVVSAKLAVNGGLTVAISDTGIGMERERIGHALEPFKQLDSRLARRFEGVGLGLPLANAFARLHGAQLAIDSTPGKGTVVTIAFPPERTLPERQALRA